MIGNVWWVHCQLRVVPAHREICVLILHRAILHDEENYPEPSKFDPDRFLTPDGQLNPAVQDPLLAVFGFGRRFAECFFSMFTSLLCFFQLTNTNSCPSSESVQEATISSLWLIIATMLSTFEFSQAVDKDGMPIEAEIKYETGLI